MSSLELDEYFENKLIVNFDSVKHKTASFYSTNWSNNVFYSAKVENLCYI